VNDVTLIKLQKIANRKFRHLIPLCKGIHGESSLYREINGTIDMRGNIAIIPRRLPSSDAA
jgi:hypothetical protein